jgi:hypothetical protein
MIKSLPQNIRKDGLTKKNKKRIGKFSLLNMKRKHKNMIKLFFYKIKILTLYLNRDI